MYTRILIPLDGSELAEQALGPARELASCFGAELRLLRVLEPLPMGVGMTVAGLKEAQELTKTIAHEYLERVAAGLQEQGYTVQFATAGGTPHAEIVKYAEENQIDLIVMWARGQSGISRWLMGSVADRVVRGATMSVFLVRPRRNSVAST